MKAYEYVINMHLLVPSSRSSEKVKVKYKGYISKTNGRFGSIRVSQTHLVLQDFVNLQFCKPYGRSEFLFLSNDSKFRKSLGNKTKNVLRNNW